MVDNVMDIVLVKIYKIMTKVDQALTKILYKKMGIIIDEIIGKRVVITSIKKYKTMVKVDPA